MGARMRAFDWTATPLGSPQSWPLSLKAAVRILLTSRFAMWMAWGPELTFFCNEAYLPTTGIKRDWVLGARSDKVWSEIWPDIGPRITHVLETGEATWDEALLLYLKRSGFSEETYHTFSYSPLRDDTGAMAGMLCVVAEVTERVIGERQLNTLRALGERLAGAATRVDVMHALEATLRAEPRDLPFALAYICDAGSAEAGIAALHGLDGQSPAAPANIKLSDAEGVWPVARVLASGSTELIDIPPDQANGLSLTHWQAAPNQALVAPIKGAEGKPDGFLIAGLNPHRAVDSSYRGFIELLTGQVAAAIARADAYERERARAEALAEIDRAKTAFFSNVSHEFRTPLTLMLGPIEEVLAKPDDGVLHDNRALIEVAHRSGLRLLKLVNALLDFSRIEAGRTRAVFEPFDLPALTADIASNFRSLTEKAGLNLIVDCEPIPHPVYVDRDMWEKIVLNLLSNAFKFTFCGEIAVSTRPSSDGRSFELSVRDTGTGIPDEELPRLFERFHRVEGAKGRSFEGSGIGLALVQELVKLQGGSIAVVSELGAGSTFTVSIPFGTAHLPAEQLGNKRTQLSTGLRPQAYVEEAMRWLPGRPGTETAILEGSVPEASLPELGDLGTRPRILLADDNADMRDYVCRLLESRYDVEAVEDGEAALAMAQKNPPALILSDVMMPRLDGFGLVNSIRSDSALKEVPIILLSARAGEEAKVEGLDVGADDYLVKPFSARELVARVHANLAMALLRKKAQEDLRKRTIELETVLETVPAAVWFTYHHDARDVIGNRHASLLFGLAPGANLSLTAPQEQPSFKIFRDENEVPPEDLPLQRAARGEKVTEEELEIRFQDGSRKTLLIHAATLRNGSGEIEGAVAGAMDITERKQFEDHQKLLIDELNHRVKNTLAIVQSMAIQTLRHGRDSSDARQLLEGRLLALSRAHDILTRESWKGASLLEVVKDAIMPYRGQDREPFNIGGPEVILSAKQALALSMALHELCTNAVKYGALSEASGRISIIWRLTGTGPAGRLMLCWRETEGPKIKPPTTRGFGTRLLEHGLSRDLAGEVRIEYPPTGVICTIIAPLAAGDSIPRGVEAVLG